MPTPTKGMPKYEFIKIGRNIVRIIVTGSPLALLIHLLHDSSTFDPPLWLIITIGAVLGGCIFLPAKEIGDSIWAMVTFHIETSLGKPSLADNPSGEQIKEYKDWVQSMRNASPMQIMKSVIPGVARAIGLFMISVYLIVLIVSVIENQISPNDIVLFLIVSTVSLFVLYLILVVLVVILLSLGAKLYFNEYHPNK